MKLAQILFLFLLLKAGVSCSYLYGQNFTTNPDSLQQKVEQLIDNNKTDEAIVVAIQELKKAQKNKNIVQQIHWNNCLSKILRINQNFNKASKYLTESYKLSLQTNDSTILASTLFEVGSLGLLEYSTQVYEKQRYDVALEKRDTAFAIFNHLTNYFSTTKNTEEIIAKSYANLTGLYSYLQEFNNAEKAAEKSISYYKKLKDTMKIIGVKSNLAITQVLRGDYTKAEKNYLEAIPLLKDTSNLEILNLKAVQYTNLADVYQRQQRLDESIEMLKKSHTFYNLYKEKYLNNTVAEIEAQYSKEKAILKIKEENEKTSFWFSVIATTLIGLAISMFILYRNNKLKAKNLALAIEKKELEKLNEIEKLKNETNDKILAATLDGRLKERKDISNILHNSVNTLLSSANLHLQVVKKKSDNSIDELDKSRLIINEASDKVRDLSHTLLSDVLVNFGLYLAIEDLCEKYSNDSLAFKLEKKSYIPRLDQDFELKIYSIVEEITNNIIKHSKASIAEIYIQLDQNILILDIKDNGIGFSSNGSLSKGIGLAQSSVRVQQMGGLFNLESQPNKGTSIHIKVPVVYR